MVYASRTGTKRNLAAFEAHGWGLLVTPERDLSPMRLPYVLDNGAWHAFINEKPWDEPAFVRAVALVGAGARWVLLPDIVMQAKASLALSLEWLPRLEGVAPLLLAVQDGMAPWDIEPHIARVAGLFVGGSTEWKETSMLAWGHYCHAKGKLLHVGRVNTARRMALAIAAGADSVDGSSGSRFAKTVPPLDRAARQGDLLSPRKVAA
jgi:hypothetical protein